ncbi:hypothetical protein JHK85_012642 [Glycine max]|nr:hypothetical protein JHK85_012642 [Glycine max]
MEDQCGGNGKHMNTNTNSNGYVDTSKAERAVWLMKCPPLVSRSLRAPPSDPSRPVAKVVVSIDPLNSNDDDSPPQVLLMGKKSDWEKRSSEGPDSSPAEINH